MSISDDEAEKARLLQEAYEDGYTPEQRKYSQDAVEALFAEIMPPEWQEAPPPSAEIISIVSRKKLK